MNTAEKKNSMQMNKIIIILCILAMLTILVSCENSSSTLESGFENSMFQNTENKDPIISEETERILKLLIGYADLYWGMFPLNDLPDELVNKSQFIDVDCQDGYQRFYKVISGDIQSETQLTEKLDVLLTEKLKKKFLEDPERPFVFSEGGLYIRSRGAGGTGLGMDCLFLDSIEYPDENKIIITVTSYGDKNKWELSADIRETASATLLKTADGLRIDECGSDILNYFWFYREISYENSKIIFDEL